MSTLDASIAATKTATTATTTTSTTAASTNANTAKASSERFLKLLVTQLKNQDPLNPVDNAQMTSQMAQISTVSGIEKLNTTVEGLTGQFVQMQMMQGAALVGKDVIVKGDKLSVSNGVAEGVFEIASAADRVSAELLSPAGTVVDTLNLGAQGSGRHSFRWPAGGAIDESAGYRFRVTAYSGSTALPATALMRDTVNAVNTSGAALTLELARNGKLPYSQVQAID